MRTIYGENCGIVVAIWLHEDGKTTYGIVKKTCVNHKKIQQNEFFPIH